MHFTKQSHWGMCYFMTHIYIHAFTHKLFFLVKGILWHTSMYVFDKHFHATSHIYAYFLKGSLCYLLTNIHILKGIFTLPIQHIQILKGIFCYIFTHFARHFHAIYSHFARHFHAIYLHTLQCIFMLNIHIYTYYWKVFFMLPRCRVFLMRQQIQILVKNFSNMF